MKRRTIMIRGMLAVVVWLGVGLGAAQAAVIFPVSTDSTTTPPFKPNTSSTVTISILQNNVDVTATWLPEPGQSVQVVVNGLGTPPAISLVCPDGSLNSTSSCLDGSASTANPIAPTPTLRTSSHPGQCTNFNNPSPLTTYASDFQLSGNTLTSTDCGGMALLVVNPGTAGALTFVLPQDSNFNGVPDIWEAAFCLASSCPTGKEDGDVGSGGAPPGDGLAAVDEYRGFMVSGVHVRTDPRQKNLFVHLVNPQCGGPSLLPTYFPDGTSLFANVNNLISGTQVHLLGFTPGGVNSTTAEWVDRFFSYTVASGFQYKVNPTDTTTTSTAPADDRQINKNAVYPLSDTATGNTIQKGLRVTECRESPPPAAIPTTPLGSAGPGTPNGPDNAIIYTQRIVNSVNRLIAASSKPLRYSTFVNGAWQTSSSASCPQCGPVGLPTDANAVNLIIARAIQFYLAMEIGHAVKLTPVFSTTYGYHNAPFTGDNLDQAITTKIDKGGGGFNTFYIPSLYNSTDQVNFRLKN